MGSESGPGADRDRGHGLIAQPDEGSQREELTGTRWCEIRQHRGAHEVGGVLAA